MVEPVHLQDNLSKIPLLQKINEATRVAPEVAKEQIAEQLKLQKNEKASKAQESQKGGKVKIQDKKQDHNKRKRRNKLRELTAEEIEKPDADETEPEQSGKLIDIVV